MLGCVERNMGSRTAVVSRLCGWPSFTQGHGDQDAQEKYLRITEGILSHVDPAVQSNDVVQMFAERLASLGRLRDAEVWYNRLLQGSALPVEDRILAMYALGQIAEVTLRAQRARGVIEADEYLYRRQDVMLWYDKALQEAAAAQSKHVAGVRTRREAFLRDAAQLGV